MLRKILSTGINTTRLHLALLLFRLSVGGMILMHGYPKFLRLLQGDLKFGDPLGIGSELSFVLVVIAEFFGSLLLIFGFGTRIGAFLLSFTMFVAGFIRHAADPFFTKEKAFLDLASFIIILIVGPGKHSIDSRLKY